ncbi:protease inhibitor I42 family protein [Streptosporangium carneum]|uniref:protease inhibitor I42 family protein n=1 Tax=Streptosporangium carneum TaxID=47481 RepID=UPI0022F2D286|nr:protease inhibitor I42 family protein [Streptosporangium carneum]
MIYRTWAVALLLVALVTGCGPGGAVSDFGTVVHGGVGKTVDVPLTPGRRFSLAVEENRSAGEGWRLAALPDVKVASFISEEYRAGDGGGGVRYFVFNAKYPGTTTVTLIACERCADGRTPAGGQGGNETGKAVFRITVA